MLGGCISLPPNLPMAYSLSLTKNQEKTLTQEFERQGFLNPIFLMLNTNYTPDNTPTYIFSDITFMIHRQSGWTKKRIAEYTRHLPVRLGECNVALGPIMLVFFDLASIDQDISLSLLASRIPDQNHPLFFFAKSTGYDKFGQSSGGLVMLDKKGRSFAVIASHNPKGKAYDPEQILAHELGHIAGIEHEKTLNDQGNPNVDLMQPRGCCYCSFNRYQCKKIQLHAKPL